VIPSGNNNWISAFVENHAEMKTIGRYGYVSMTASSDTEKTMFSQKIILKYSKEYLFTIIRFADYQLRLVSE